MSYLEVHYISKKLKSGVSSFTKVLIDSEIEDFCADILHSTLNNKKEKLEYPFIVGVQQELIIQGFLYLLCTKYNNQLDINDVHFYIDNVQIKFDYNNPWKVILNEEDLSKINYYSKFVMGIALSE